MNCHFLLTIGEHDRNPGLACIQRRGQRQPATIPTPAHPRGEVNCLATGTPDAHASNAAGKVSDHRQPSPHPRAPPDPDPPTLWTPPAGAGLCEIHPGQETLPQMKCVMMHAVPCACRWEDTAALVLNVRTPTRPELERRAGQHDGHDAHSMRRRRMLEGSCSHKLRKHIRDLHC